MQPRFDAVATVVADMARSLAFYRLLGLDIPPEADGESYVSIDLQGGIRMEWNTDAFEQTFNPSWSGASGSGRVGVVLAFDSPGDVDRVHADVVAAGYGVALEPFDAPWGTRHCRVLDPDGNAVDLISELRSGGEDQPIG